MLHVGVEWPPKERENFANTIKDAEWPVDWFSIATSGDQPWMFYMSKIFIEHCIESVQLISRGIEEFCIQRNCRGS